MVRRYFKPKASKPSLCNCAEREPQFSEDGLLEWCANCGMMIADHHKRKFSKPHPSI